MTRDEIERFVLEADCAESEVLLADGFDEAFLGLGQRFNATFAVYDLDRCIEILVDDGASHEQAWEHFEFNVVGAWVGEATPAFIKLAHPQGGGQ